MCVIMWVTEDRPNDIMIDKAWDKNDDGGGVAWRETNRDSSVEVVWRKGIEDVEEMKELCRSLPLPYIAHFRVASCGGIRPSLTHPFPIDKQTSLDIDGRTKGWVLFHNGDWKGWSNVALEVVLRTNTPIPVGKWSDSRAIAWLCSIYGLGFMEFLPEQKGIAFGPDDFEVFLGRDGWTPVNNVWCSNDYFLNTKWGTSLMCKYGNCRSYNTDNKGYCPLHKDGVIQDANSVVSVPRLPTAAGGTQQPAIPFQGKSAATPLISLETAERLHNQKDREGKRVISKNLIKRVRALYADLAAPGNGKQAERAVKSLEALSRSLNMSGRAASMKSLIHMVGGLGTMLGLG